MLISASLLWVPPSPPQQLFVRESPMLTVTPPGGASYTTWKLADT